MVRDIVEFFSVSKYYLSMTHPARGALENIPRMNEEKQKVLLESTVFHQLAILYPPSLVYTAAFLKALINKLETDGIEVCDNLYNAYASLIVKSDSPEKICYSSYLLDSASSVSLLTSSSIVSKSTTGLCVWEASKFLSEWCMENAEYLKDKSILELGCGTGLTGLVVCKTCQPKSYIFTDSHSDVLNIVSQNIHLNNHELTSAISVKCLDWEDCEQEEITADIILGADLVYDVRLVPYLVKTLNRYLTRTKAIAYVACTQRNPETIALFLKEIEQSQLEVQLLQLPRREVFNYTGETILLYKVLH